MQEISQEVRKKYGGLGFLAYCGILLSLSLTWLVSLINDRYIQRRSIYPLILNVPKRIKLPFLGSERQPSPFLSNECLSSQCMLKS